MLYTSSPNEREALVTQATLPYVAQAVLDVVQQLRPDQYTSTQLTNLVAMLAAQSRLETGGWWSMWNWNLGNVKSGSGAPHMYLQGVSEIEDGVEVHPKPPDPRTRFRAFDSLPQGAQFFTLFFARDKYRHAWAAALAGKPHGFVEAIKAQRYFSGSLSKYRNAVGQIYRQIWPEVRQVVGKQGRRKGGIGALPLLLFAGGLGLAWGLRRKKRGI